MTTGSMGLSPGITVIGNCCPFSSNEASRALSRRRSRIRRCWYGVFRDRSSSITISPDTSPLPLPKKTGSHSLQDAVTRLLGSQESRHLLASLPEDLFLLLVR